MIDIFLLLHGDGPGFFVCAFHQPDPYSLCDKLLYILPTSIETGLNHGTYVLKLLMHTQRNIDRLLCIGRSLHVDTHEDRIFVSMFKQPAHILFTELLGNIQAKGSELDGNIRIDTGLLDSIKDRDKILCGCSGLPVI